MDRIWFENPLAVFTATGDDAIGGVVVEGSQIVEVVPAGATPVDGHDQVFDARRHVILPGLITTHHHFYQTLTRAWAPVVHPDSSSSARATVVASSRSRGVSRAQIG